MAANNKKKKFRVYVKLKARISTDIMASSKEEAKALINSINLNDSLKNIDGREWDVWQSSNGVERVSEVVKTTSEIER